MTKRRVFFCTYKVRILLVNDEVNSRDFGG